MPLVTARQNSAPRYTVEQWFDWHSLFWAEGQQFQAQGYADTNTVTTWPNETGESDLDSTDSTKPTYVASESDLNSKPAVSFTNHNLYTSSAFTSNPSYTSGATIVMILDLDVGGGYQCDGIAANNRNIMSNTSVWRIFGGDSFVTGGTPTTGQWLLRGFFSGDAGNEIMWANEVQVASGNGGSDTLTGVTIGGVWGGGSPTFSFPRT